MWSVHLSLSKSGLHVSVVRSGDVISPNAQPIGKYTAQLHVPSLNVSFHDDDVIRAALSGDPAGQPAGSWSFKAHGLRLYRLRSLYGPERLTRSPLTTPTAPFYFPCNRSGARDEVRASPTATWRGSAAAQRRLSGGSAAASLPRRPPWIIHVETKKREPGDGNVSEQLWGPWETHTYNTHTPTLTR